MNPVFFADRSRQRRAGFTLLEVMVAIAILSIGMVTLLQVQARSAMMAEQAKAMTVGVQLARGKLYDCEVEMLKRGFSVADFKEEGRFDEEGYDDFFWECHAYKPELPMPDAQDFVDAASSSANATSAGEGAEPGGGLLGALGGAGGGVDPGMMGAGVGMIAPVLSQVSELVGESIRELTVVVRWKQGNTWDEVRVTTHLVDATGVNALAQQIQGMAGQLQGLSSLMGGAPGGSAPATTGGRSPTPARNNSLPRGVGGN